jgi:hypothetical protein
MQQCDMDIVSLLIQSIFGSDSWTLLNQRYGVKRCADRNFGTRDVWIWTKISLVFTIPNFNLNN